MIDQKFLNARHYIVDTWGAATSLSDLPEDTLMGLSWGVVFEAYIKPALPHEFPGLFDQWSVLRSHDATREFTGAWTARMHSTTSDEVTFHFEVEEDAIIARLIIGSA